MIYHDVRLKLNTLKLQSFFYFLIFIIGWPLWGQTVDKKEDLQNKSNWEKFLIIQNKNLSVWFNDFAQDIDLFLAGKQLTQKENFSRLKFENITQSTEGHVVTNDFSASAILHLPNVEEYWQLKFTSYDELNERRKSQKSYLRSKRQENYGATISLFRKLGNIHTTFQPRIELKNPIKVSHSLSFESEANTTYFNLNPKLELYASADKGTGVYWALNFLFSIDNSHTLTFINDGDYVAQTHQESVTNGFSLLTSLSDKMSYSKGILFFSNNRPHYHLDGYSFYFTWNHTIYKNIFSYHLTPHLDFNVDDCFRGRSGLSLELVFNF